MRKLYIIKIGGNVIDDREELEKFLSDFAAVPGNKILVHGGGKAASQLAQKLGIAQVIVNGRRVTDAETLKVTTMVYAGLLNKQIVASLQAKDVNAVGLSGADMNILKASRRMETEINFGFVGDLDESGVNSELIGALLDCGAIPVFCSVTHDGKGQLLNTNADTIASVLAVALSQQFDVQLNYCFEKKGVLRNMEDEASVIDTMTKTEYKKLTEEGIISKGMIPKLDNSFGAIEKGVKSVIIGHHHDLEKIITKKEHAGTILIA